MKEYFSVLRSATLFAGISEEELAAIAEALAKPTPEQRCEALENTVAEQDDLMAQMLYELTILNIGGDEA